LAPGQHLQGRKWQKDNYVAHLIALLIKNWQHPKLKNTNGFPQFPLQRKKRERVKYHKKKNRNSERQSNKSTMSTNVL